MYTVYVFYYSYFLHAWGFGFQMWRLTRARGVLLLLSGYYSRLVCLSCPGTLETWLWLCLSMIYLCMRTMVRLVCRIFAIQSGENHQALSAVSPLRVPERRQTRLTSPTKLTKTLELITPWDSWRNPRGTAWGPSHHGTPDLTSVARLQTNSGPKKSVYKAIFYSIRTDMSVSWWNVGCVCVYIYKYWM